MSKKTDSNLYTILFVFGMVGVVGFLLSFTASSLKPSITTNKQLEKQQNILYAMGVNENEGNKANFVGTDVAPDLFKKYITKQLVIQGGEVKEDTTAYLIDVKKEKALAKNPDYQRRLPLFIGEKDGETYYIAPIRGKGLWDAIWAYIAVDEDMVILGAYFDHKAETPGLGANIKERFFMDDFIGEHLTKDAEFVGVDVAKGNADPKNLVKDDNEVDAIAGATITGDGVSAMIKSDLRLYVPYFKSLKSN